MKLNAPTLFSYENAVLEPEAVATNIQLRRFDQVIYRFFEQMWQAMLAFPAAIIAGTVAGKTIVNGSTAIITTEALTTAAGALATLTIIGNEIVAGTNLVVSVSNGTNTGGAPLLWSVVVTGPAKANGSGTAVVTVKNIGTTAFNGSLQLNILGF